MTVLSGKTQKIIAQFFLFCNRKTVEKINVCVSYFRTDVIKDIDTNTSEIQESSNPSTSTATDIVTDEAVQEPVCSLS